MSDFKEFSGFEILRKIELRGEDAHSWVAVVGDGSLDTVVMFATELESQSDQNLRVRIVDIAGMLVRDIRDTLRSSLIEHVILIGFEGRSKGFWTSLDINRSALERSGALFFWLTAKALSNLCRYAPNIKSYIGTAIFQLKGVIGALTAEERNVRLEELSKKFRMNDSELIKRAEAHQIDPEPEFVEWLLLLGRSDLV